MVRIWAVPTFTTLTWVGLIVTDEEALRTARLLAREEGMFVGVSSGTNVWAMIKVAEELGGGKTLVTLLGIVTLVRLVHQ
jgi:cysteine synthase